MPDTVYVFTNEAMPGLVKIGLTSDTVEARLTTLSSHTGVPLPFECYFAADGKVEYEGELLSPSAAALNAVYWKMRYR